MKPAIVVVGYNRPESLRRLLNSISEAKYPDKDVTLIISLDKASNQNDVLKVAEEYEWNFGEKFIRTFPERCGLRKHIISCGELSLEYGAVIILEDDLIVSPGFYTYVMSAIEYYSAYDEIAGIALYSHEWNGYAGKSFTPIKNKYDTYLGQFSITWGQCWTAKQWIGFHDWYRQNENQLEYSTCIPAQINCWGPNSWGKYFVHYIVENDLYYVVPYNGFSTNCSEIGQHAANKNMDHQVSIMYDNKCDFNFAPVDDAMKYDIFFENKRLTDSLTKYIDNEEVTIDLGGQRNDFNTRYILTTRALSFRCIKTFGAERRPIDMNVVKDMPGNDIYLYDTKAMEKKPKINRLNLIRYELRGMSNKTIIKYEIMLIIKTIRKKLGMEQ